MSISFYSVKTESIFMTMKQLKNPQKIGEQETAQKVSTIIPVLGWASHSGLSKLYDRKNKRSVWLVPDKSHGKYETQENESKHRQGIHANRGDNLIAVRTKLPTQKDFVEFLRSKTKAKILAEHTDIPLTKIEHWFRFE